jgi:UTP--glucose-1-phosphate uridylyltransferase
VAADFTPFERKMREAGLPEVAIRTFERAYGALAEGATGMLTRREIEPIEALPAAADLAGGAEEGRAALGRTVVIKLNGGLGTSMGMTRAKSLLPVKDGLSFLDITARQILGLRERTGHSVPLVLMDSFRTREDSLAALAKHGDLSAPLPPDFLQHRVPRIRVDDLTPIAWPAAPQHEWCPPGHGDLYTALVTSGMLETMLGEGLRYAFVSNADNLGAVLDLDLLGGFVASGAPFAMEVKERGAADRKGGHLARLRSGGLVLRESAQCPEDEIDEFQDTKRYRFFNTNNLWIDLEALRDVLAARDGVLPLPLIRNEKPVDPADAASPRVYQLETAMGAAISVFDGAIAIRVPAHRFAPVKTTADLLVVRSDATRLTEDHRIVPAEGSAGDALVVDLDPACFKRVEQLDARTAAGPPSLRACRRLEVRGDVSFGRDVVIEGEVVVAAPDGEALRIPDGARLGGQAA